VHICFVCTGNICRSPIAASVLRTAVERAGLRESVTVTSAGTGGWHRGDPADRRAQAVLAQAGYPSEHTARQIGPDQLDADLFLALDSSHATALRQLGVDEGRIRLLMSFVPGATELDVPDPYFGDRRDFEDVLAMAQSALPGLLEWVRERLAES
jgi:protein-tyrosine phosphatase